MSYLVHALGESYGLKPNQSVYIYIERERETDRQREGLYINIENIVGEVDLLTKFKANTFSAWKNYEKSRQFNEFILQRYRIRKYNKDID